MGNAVSSHVGSRWSPSHKHIFGVFIAQEMRLMADVLFLLNTSQNWSKCGFILNSTWQLSSIVNALQHKLTFLVTDCAVVQMFATAVASKEQFFTQTVLVCVVNDKQVQSITNIVT